MAGSNSALIVVLTLSLHLAAVFLGFRFHLWLLDKTSSSSSWSSWWSKNQSAACDDNVSVASLSDPQIAFLQTFGLWLLVIGFVARWRFEILLIVFVGLVLLMQNYPNDGKIPEDQVYVAVLGYIAWLAVLATTAALLLWPCRVHFGMGNLDADYYQKVAIGGAISTSFVAALALIAFCLKRPQIVQDAGDCMESSLV